MKSLWDGQLAVHYYMEELFRYFNQNGFQKFDMDSCLVHGRTGDVVILKSIIINEFMVVVTRMALTEQFSDLVQRNIR